MIDFHNPSGVPAPAGHYSHVARVDLGGATLLQLSGQAALDEQGAVVGPGDMSAQAAFVMDAIGTLLAADGAGFDDVVNIRSYLTDMGQLQEYARVRRPYFPNSAPTSTTVGVAALFRPGLVLEVEVMAVLRG